MASRTYFVFSGFVRNDHFVSFCCAEGMSRSILRNIWNRERGASKIAYLSDFDTEKPVKTQSLTAGLTEHFNPISSLAWLGFSAVAALFSAIV